MLNKVSGLAIFLSICLSEKTNKKNTFLRNTHSASAPCRAQSIELILLYLNTSSRHTVTDMLCGESQLTQSFVSRPHMTGAANRGCAEACTAASSHAALRTVPPPVCVFGWRAGRGINAARRSRNGNKTIKRDILR